MTGRECSGPVINPGVFEVPASLNRGGIRGCAPGTVIQNIMVNSYNIDSYICYYLYIF